MKHIILFLAFAGLTILFGCSNSQQKAKPVNMDGLKAGKHCYLAVFDKDSASISFDISTSGRITGQLNINYHNTDSVSASREPNSGDITGEFRGDTLFADYNFTSGTKDKTHYINPVALLHKGDSLIMGHGVIYDYLGRTYFDPKVPIDFKKGKFRFALGDCKTK